MKNITCLYDRCINRLRGPGAEVLSLMVRLTLGCLFIDSGWQKWHNLDQIISFFRDLGIPAPQLQGPMVATFELVGGTLILVGLFARLASLPLMGTMIVALLTAKKDDLHGFSDLIGFVEFLYLLLLAYVVVYGAGRLSADHALTSRPKGSPRKMP